MKERKVHIYIFVYCTTFILVFCKASLLSVSDLIQYYGTFLMETKERIEAEFDHSVVGVMVKSMKNVMMSLRVTVVNLIKELQYWQGV